MAPSTRRTKRRSSFSDDPDLAGPQQKKLGFGISKGGATRALFVKFPHLAKEHFSEPAAAAPLSLIVTFPYSAEEHPTRASPTSKPPTKAPRGRPPKNKQKADQKDNSFSVDTRPKSWGMPEVWAEVFY